MPDIIREQQQEVQQTLERKHAATLMDYAAAQAVLCEVRESLQRIRRELDSQIAQVESLLGTEQPQAERKRTEKSP